MQYFGFDRPSFGIKTFGFGSSEFSPLDLFAGGKQGVWYDPSDKSTLFQDEAGIIPVTKDGDPIGLMKDKSGNGNHATQSVSAARPIYRTDGVLHWFELDAVDDSFVIPLALGGKTFTLALAYIQPNSADSFMLVNSIEISNYAFVAVSDSTSTTISYGSVVNYIRANGVLTNANRRNMIHANLISSNVFVGNVTYDSDGWGSLYGYSSNRDRQYLGLKKNTGYIMVEGNPDISETERYLARKSGVTL